MVDIVLLWKLFCGGYCFVPTGKVGLGVGSWPSNRATEGSYPK